MKRMRFGAYLAALAALAVTFTAGASDSDKPIQLEADNLTVEEPSGISTYSGNVNVSQGSHQLQAHEVRIHSEGEEIVRIVATGQDGGSRARYEQAATDGRDHLVGEARRIVYHVREERVEFIGDASLARSDETTVSGDRVNYDAAAGRVDASSGGEGRVKTTIRQRQDG